MKRGLRLLLRTVLFLAAFLTAFWTFMPWREVGSAGLSAAEKRLDQKGMRLSWSGVESVGGGFRVRNLELGGFVKLSFESLTIRPQFFAGLLALAPVCEVRFREGLMTMGQPMAFGEGELLLTASPREILLEKLLTRGDFAVKGFLTVDPARMKIGRAEASVAVPADFESNMETLKGFLPLVKEGDNWYLRRERPKEASK